MQSWLEDPEKNGYQSLRYARSIDGGVQWQCAQHLDIGTPVPAAGIP